MPDVGRHKICLYFPYLLLYWVHSSIHYPAWPQGYTRAAFLSNSSLPSLHCSGGRERGKKGHYETKKTSAGRRKRGGRAQLAVLTSSPPSPGAA